MRIIKVTEVTAMSGELPVGEAAWQAAWLEGPFTGDRLDVGMVTMRPGGATPPHVHLGGQVLVVTAGEGFVETGGARHTISAGDVVVCPPGEEHVHGASDTHHIAHLSITTGTYIIPSASPGGTVPDVTTDVCRPRAAEGRTGRRASILSTDA